LKHAVYYLLLFLSNSGYANAPQCCVVCTVTRSQSFQTKTVMLTSYCTTASLHTLA